jgi:hypothetical protein
MTQRQEFRVLRTYADFEEIVIPAYLSE